MEAVAGVFDGHGPLGHETVSYLADRLPAVMVEAIALTSQNPGGPASVRDAIFYAFGQVGAALGQFGFGQGSGATVVITVVVRVPSGPTLMLEAGAGARGGASGIGDDTTPSSPQARPPTTEAEERKFSGESLTEGSESRSEVGSRAGARLRVYVAQVGDSEAHVFPLPPCTAPSSMPLELLDGDRLPALSAPMTTPHRLSNPKERRRLAEFHGQSSSSVGGPLGTLDGYITNAAGGALSVTRALGDVDFSELGVSAVPDVRTYELNREKELALVLGSDGFWDHMSPEYVGERIRQSVQASDEASVDALEVCQSLLEAVEFPEDDASCVLLAIRPRRNRGLPATQLPPKDTLLAVAGIRKQHGQPLDLVGAVKC